jgi:hypothetical protein
MTSSTAKACNEILSKVEGMMDSVDVARLTQEQFEEVKRLKAELENACAADDKNMAERMEERIVSIIKEGPPGYG